MLRSLSLFIRIRHVQRTDKVKTASCTGQKGCLSMTVEGKVEIYDRASLTDKQVLQLM